MSEQDPRIDRRKVLKGLGASATVTTFAGCTGGGDGGGTPTEGDGGGSTPTEGDGGGGTTGTPGDSGEWPDLSGQEVHLLTDETSDPFRNLFDRLGADFADATGAEVRNEYAGTGSSIEERVAQLVQAGDPPEILFTSGGQAARFAQEDLLASVTEVIEHWEEQWGDLSERYRVQVDGEDVHLPVSSKGYAFWYRDDISGFSDVPDSWSDLDAGWSEWLDAASQAEGEQGLNGTYLPRGQGACPEIWHWGQAWSNGANICGRRDGEVVIVMDQGDNVDRWVEKLEFDKQLHQYSPPATDSGCGTMTQAVPSQVSASSHYIISRPKVQAVQRDTGFADAVRGTAPPMGKGEVHSGNSEGFVAFDTENSEAGVEWMKFLNQLDYQFPLYEITPFQIQPIFPDVKETDRWSDFVEGLDSAWTEQDMAAAQHDQYQIAPNETDPPNPFTGNLLSAQHVTAMVFEVTINGKDPETAVMDTAEELRSILQDVKG